MCLDMICVISVFFFHAIYFSLYLDFLLPWVSGNSQWFCAIWGSCSWYILPWGVHTAVCSSTTFLSVAKTGELIWQPAHYLTFLVLLYDPASVSFAQFPNWSPLQDSAHPFLLVINLCSCEKTDTLEKYFKMSNFLRHYLKWGHYLLYCWILHSVSPP